MVDTLDLSSSVTLQYSEYRVLVPGPLLPESPQNIPLDLCLKNITSHQKIAKFSLNLELLSYQSKVSLIMAQET
jgi:hypothetical protein